MLFWPHFIEFPLRCFTYFTAELATAIIVEDHKCPNSSLNPQTGFTAILAEDDGKLILSIMIAKKPCAGGLWASKGG